MLVYLGLFALAVVALGVYLKHKLGDLAKHKHVLVAAVGGAVLVVPLAQLSPSEKERLQLDFESAGHAVVVMPATANATPPSEGDVRAAQVVKSELEQDGYTVDQVDVSDALKKTDSQDLLQVTGVNGLTTALGNVAPGQ